MFIILLSILEKRLVHGSRENLAIRIMSNVSKIRNTNQNSTKCIQKHTASKVETYEYTIKLDQRQVLAQQAAP